MNRKSNIILFILLAFTTAAFAQTDKEDRKEQQEEKKNANKEKVDFGVFRRLIMSTKEFSDERRKIPALQKANKVPVKIIAVVDSMADSDSPTKLIGYIRQDIGDISTNVYEVVFDRTIKKIISVKPTGDANDEDKDETANEKKTPGKHIGTKKKKDDEDEDDEDEKPSKKKQKDDDD
jgi:hypothetical protein